jgi:hypothetical protein
MQEASAFQIGKTGGKRRKFAQRVSVNGLAIRAQPQLLQPADPCRTAGVVFGIHRAGLFRRRETVGHQERPPGWNRDCTQIQRSKLYPESAAGLTG